MANSEAPTGPSLKPSSWMSSTLSRVSSSSSPPSSAPARRRSPAGETQQAQKPPGSRRGNDIRLAAPSPFQEPQHPTVSSLSLKEGRKEGREGVYPGWELTQKEQPGQRAPGPQHFSSCAGKTPRHPPFQIKKNRNHHQARLGTRIARCPCHDPCTYMCGPGT